MSKNSLSTYTYVQKPMPAEIQVMFMLPLLQTLYVVLVHFNTTQLFILQRCALRRKFLVSGESPDRHSLIHQSLHVPPKPKIQRKKVRRLYRSGDSFSTPHPLPTKSPVQVLSHNKEKMRWCPIMHEPHVLPLMKRHMFQVYCKIT
jgi:hypothetical protein